MKTAEEIRQDLIARFETRVQDTIEEGSMLDIYNTVLGEIGAQIYEEIDKNRTPHLWSSLEGQQLDDTGTMLNLPRKEGESDDNYKYRLMNWTLSNEASNLTAINDALLTPTYASNIEFRPKVHGCGTAVCYVIPKEYTTYYITNSLWEAQQIVESIASPSLYVQYIVPKILGIRFQCYLTSSTGDIPSIRSNIESKVMEYINNIPPYAYLQIGQVNRIGLNESQVDYFNVQSVMINDVVITNVAFLQDIDTKILFDEIIWAGDE